MIHYTRIAFLSLSLCALDNPAQAVSSWALANRAPLLFCAEARIPCGTRGVQGGKQLFCVCHGARWSADSPNPSRVDAFTSMQDVGTHGNPLEPIGTHGNPLEPIGTPVPEGRFSSLFPFRLPVFSSLLPWTTGRVSERRFVGGRGHRFPVPLGDARAAPTGCIWFHCRSQTSWSPG